MTLNSALASALSGLTATSRQIDVAARNVSNANTEGFVRRIQPLEAQVLGSQGAGVRAGAVELAEAPALTADRRLAEADVGFQDAVLDAAETLEGLIGGPDDPGSLFSRFANFETSLRDFADQPQQGILQIEVLSRAEDVTAAFNEINQGVLDLRERIDTEIARQVDRVNEILPQIEELNRAAQRATAFGADGAEIAAQRSGLIDELASILPVQTQLRDNGVVSVLTETGTPLVNPRAGTFEFTEAGVITSAADLVGGAPGGLSGLTLDGIDVTPNVAPSSPLTSGSLAALFQVRDVTTVDFQNQIDAVAGDLIARFSDPTVEAAITPGDPGLFTDAGAAPTGAPGLAGRISINALVDPDQGGALDALRTGIGGAAVPIGDNTQAVALLGALTASTAAPAALGALGDNSATGLVADFSSLVATAAFNAEQAQVLRAARFETFSTAEQGVVGVDTDVELANVAQLQNAFSANAQVLSTIDELFTILLQSV